MNSLSNREKKMLYFLLCFLIVMGGIFLLVLPALNRSQQSKEQLAEKQLEKQQMELSMQRLSINQDNLAKLQETLTAEKGQYYPVMTNQDIDRTITGIVSQYLPISSELEITSPKQREITPYDPEKAGKNDQSSDQQEENTSSKTWVSQVKLKSAGNLDGLIGLVAKINENPSVRIIEMNNTVDKQTGSFNVNITFEVLMME